MKLRDEIAAIIRVKTLAYHGVLPEVVADRILAKVREALLSEDAVEKGAIAMLDATFEFPGAGKKIWTEINVDDNPYGTRFDTGSPDKVLSEARATITAALDAITGEDK